MDATRSFEVIPSTPRIEDLAYKAKQIFKQSDEPLIDLYNFALKYQLNFKQVYRMATTNYKNPSKRRLAYLVDREERDIKRYEWAVARAQKLDR